jgi:hypothetical protein
MISSFSPRPRPGCRLLGVWPPEDDPPAGWQRSDGARILVWRIMTGEAADHAVETIGYTDSADCGVTHFRSRGKRIAGV